jgi:tetratricopeptide (TPR) repeat protein
MVASAATAEPGVRAVPALPAAPAPLRRGAGIDRYVVLGLVGRGGMGEVYAAYDPELDRKVAIKLLRVELGGPRSREAQVRLRREAQAIARLSHPNVVVVHDVGTFQERVFLAMEFVEGHTLRYWLEARRRGWREIVRVFVAAGRGLAAAHRAGLVHRDFKPDNVMVGHDGQVRVMDFGLARQAVSRTPTGEHATDPGPRPLAIDEQGDTPVIDSATGAVQPELPQPGSGALDLVLTRVGAVVGTPAYMSPEQCFGRASDARSDQFSFCVALYEALHGERPFQGKTMVALRASLLLGELQDPPASAAVPSWLRRLLLRGLMTDPADRYASLDQLLDALESRAGAHRRRWIAGGAAAACLVGALMTLGPEARGRDRLCAAGGDKLAGIWEPAGGAPPPASRRDAIRRAFASTGKGFAADAFAGVARALDRYTSAWAAMYKDACEATQVRGEQSAEVLDLRMACLQERLGGVRALSDVFVSGSALAVENAVSAAGALAPLDRCADVPSLRAVVKPPDDAHVRAEVAELRRRLPELKALGDSGQCGSGLRRARLFLRDVREVGYLPLLAEASAAVGFLETECGDLQEGERLLKQAFWRAQEARDDRVAAEAAVLVVQTVGERLGKLDQAQEWAEHARAAIGRLGGDKRLEAWLWHGSGAALYHAGQLEGALAESARALALKREMYGDESQDVGRSLNNVAAALNDLGRHEEAHAAQEKALATFERTLGPEHPLVALASENLGEMLNALGRHAEARAAFARALAIWGQGGAGDFYQAFAVLGLGQSYLAEGRPADARPYLERAVQMREAADSDPGRLGEAHFALARALEPDPRARRRARRLAEQARAEYQRREGSEAKAREVADWLARRT